MDEDEPIWGAGVGHLELLIYRPNMIADIRCYKHLR